MPPAGAIRSSSLSTLSGRTGCGALLSGFFIVRPFVPAGLIALF